MAFIAGKCFLFLVFGSVIWTLICIVPLLYSSMDLRFAIEVVIGFIIYFVGASTGESQKDHEDYIQKQAFARGARQATIRASVAGVRSAQYAYDVDVVNPEELFFLSNGY
ncbi:hypothetical protein BDF19DRAFT_428321 [Syncephalis fuscata]|nr:hypothetical protein BDF19DRAFT_428321 [Syncephalis fuscata]